MARDVPIDVINHRNVIQIKYFFYLFLLHTLNILRRVVYFRFEKHLKLVISQPCYHYSYVLVFFFKRRNEMCALVRLVLLTGNCDSFFQVICF